MPFNRRSSIVNCESRQPAVVIDAALYRQLVRLCIEALPHKSYGLVGGVDLYHPKTLYPCCTNLRNEPEWKSVFEAFGEFYRNPDLGFVISASEVKAVLDVMKARSEAFVGVFHSHRFLRAEPSEIDIYLSSGHGLLSYIVSVVNPSAPEVGVFCIEGTGYRRVPVLRCQELQCQNRSNAT